ncbi:T9SS type A sorting domain-containing protein [bacterium SCSIO 12741]|nr:T9SS type A sorting domain-containing protein [bacterium SCSIO 12741]
MLKLWTCFILTLGMLQLSAQRTGPILVYTPQKAKVQKLPAQGMLATVNAFYSEDFEAAGDTFPHNQIVSITSGTDKGYYRGSSAESNVGQVWKVPDHGRFAYTNDDYCNCDKSADTLAFPSIDMTGKQAVVMQFSYYFNRVNRNESAKLMYRYGSGVWVGHNLPPKQGWHTISIPLNGATGMFNMAFVYNDGGGVTSWGSGLAVDDISFCESTHTVDLVQDSFKINQLLPEEFYKVLPFNQASSRTFEVESRIWNQGKDTARKAKVITSVLIKDQEQQETNPIDLAFAQGDRGPSLVSYIPAKGTGSYLFQSVAVSDSVDRDPSSDTVAFNLELSDTTLSRVHRKSTDRGFWYGPGLDYSLIQEIDLTAGDTVSSMSIFFHKNTEAGGKIDLVLMDQFFQNAIRLTGNDYHLNITVKKEHIGKWVTFPIPLSAVPPGKYYMGVKVRSGNVVMGVSESTIKARLVQARIGASAWIPVDYMPFAQLHFRKTSCSHIATPLRISKPNCGFNNGGIHIGAIGGTEPYKFQWGANTGYDTDTLLTGLRSGHYTVTVTDSVGCTRIRHVALSDQGSVSMNTTVLDHEVCFGDSLGEIQIQPLGGTKPYSVQWSNGGTDTINTKLVAGNYTVTVTDAASPNCLLIQSFQVLGPEAPLAVSAKTTDNFCYSDKQGEIRVTAQGGFGTYAYAWSDTSNKTPVATQLASGWHKVTVTDANLCTVIDSFEIKSFPELKMTSTVIDTSTLGSISTQVSGGAPSYTYFWKGPGGFVNPGTPEIIELQKQGQYIVVVTDSAGCQITDTFQLGGVVSVTPIESTPLEARLYPNPSRGSVTLETSEFPVQWQVIDPSGRILNSGETSGPIQTLDLQPGTYWIRIQGTSQAPSVLPVVILRP